MEPDGHIRVSQLASGFVDDITHWNIDMERSLTSGDNSEMIQTETTVAAQWWEELLYTTGGNLELTKCFYYQIVWEFDADGNTILKEPTANIILQDSVINSHSECTAPCSPERRQRSSIGPYVCQVSHTVSRSVPSRKSKSSRYKAVLHRRH
jgi:hypothetical protein